MTTPPNTQPDAAQIAREMRAGLEGVTTGDWWVPDKSPRSVWSDGYTVFVAECGDFERGSKHGVEDAAHIARCSRRRIVVLLNAFDAQTKEIAELRGAVIREGQTSYDEGFSHARSALLAQRDAAVARAEKAEADAAEGDQLLDAQEAKLRALAPHGTCGCSVDKPDDLCMHHSPQLTAALARVVQLEGENERMRARLSRANQCLGFFVSTIKCGEPWSEVCEREYAATRDSSDAGLEGENEWQPIESAPKDGTEILTVGLDSLKVIATRWLDPGPFIRTQELNYYKEVGWYWGSWNQEVIGPVSPTHWRPLPSPSKKGNMMSGARDATTGSTGDASAYAPDPFDPTKRGSSYRDLWEAATELAVEDAAAVAIMLRDRDARVAELEDALRQVAEEGQGWAVSVALGVLPPPPPTRKET